MVEVALAMLLLVGSGLLLRSFAKMLETDPGFNAEHVLTASLSLPEHDYPTEERSDAFYRELLGRAKALPGVRAAGFTTGIPATRIPSDRSFVPEGYVPQNGRRWDSVANYFVMGDYFRAMGIRLVEGRWFTAADEEPNAPLVAVVSQTAAKLYWPGKDPVGTRLRMGGNPGSTRPVITVIGVVGDVHQGALDEEVYPQMYEPLEQFQRQFEPAVQAAINVRWDLDLVMRTAGDPVGAAADLERTVHGMDPLLAVTKMQTMGDVVAATEAPRRFNTTVLSAFAGIALALSLLGIYGVLAYSVTERKREIAIRMALGATREDVRRRTLRDALVLGLVGVAAGLVAAAGLTRYLVSLLYGVEPLDAASIAGAVVVLLACSALAGWVPARRAARVEPMEALRES
jgi:putative ABC transport system permease protein